MSLWSNSAQYSSNASPPSTPSNRNATEAAKAAGYAAESAYNQGYRLLQKQEVIDRVHELEQELVTDVDVIKEMESQYEFAKANGHTNSAIKALELLSRIRGSSTDGKIATDNDTLEVAIICLLYTSDAADE